MGLAKSPKRWFGWNNKYNKWKNSYNSVDLYHVWIYLSFILLCFFYYDLFSR